MPASGRTPKIFQSDMGKDYPGPLGLAGSPGVQVEFIQPPVQLVHASMPSLPPAQEVVLDQEVRDLLDKQAVHLVDQQLQTEDFISSLFVVPKKGEGNLKSPKPVPNIRAFQNGGDTYAKRSFKAGGIGW